MALFTVEEMWENAVEERDNRNSKGDKVPLVENCIQGDGSVRFNVSSLLVLYARI